MGVGNPRFWGRGGRRGSGMVPLERALVSRPSIVTVALYLRVSEIYWAVCLHWGLRTPDFVEGKAVVGRGWYRSKERW